MNFDPQNITLVTLYGYFKDAQSQNPRHIQIPVDPQVQGELKVMLADTILVSVSRQASPIWTHSILQRNMDQKNN